MKRAAAILLFSLLSLSLASAIPKPDEKHGKDRIIEKEPLSKKAHFEEGDEHNPDYDHEAFLGEEEAHDFDDLSPEQSREKLGIIYDKIDRDHDGFVTEQELKDWIRHVQNKYVYEDSDRQWLDHTVENDKLTWENYKKRTYGSEDASEDNLAGEEEDGFSYKQMLQRDEKRWKKADQNGDGFLNKEEFVHFLHPEDAPHMKDIVVQETLDDIDRDKDGFISMEEYIGDLWPQRDAENEPEWVSSEREQFTNFRDHNQDGKMDADEVKEWIMPSDYDHSEAEAKHLIYESDIDQDKKLTKEEVLDKYDLFVGSQATDFGEALSRHDEF